MNTTIIFTILIFILSACSVQDIGIKHKVDGKCDYYSLRTARCQDTQQIVQELKEYPVIFIGDHHPEDDMHKKVAELITAFGKSGVKVHLANEWFYPSDADVLERFSNGKLTEKEFLKEIKWKERLKHNKYESFKPMYESVKNSQGQLYGINMSKEDRKKVSDQNLSGMSKEELSFNDSLDLHVYPHREQILPFLSYCHAPKKDESLKECIERMYRVQVAWDTKMALESYKLFLDLEKDEKLIVFAGSMHIENKLGIPLRFSRLSNSPTITIIPADEKTKNVENGIGDYILFYKEAKEQ